MGRGRTSSARQVSTRTAEYIHIDNISCVLYICSACQASTGTSTVYMRDVTIIVCTTYIIYTSSGIKEDLYSADQKPSSRARATLKKAPAKKRYHQSLISLATSLPNLHVLLLNVLFLLFLLLHVLLLLVLPLVIAAHQEEEEIPAWVLALSEKSHCAEPEEMPPDLELEETEDERLSREAISADERLSREAVYAQYKQEFSTPSKTTRVIRQINQDIEREEELDREAVYAQYKAEFSMPSFTRRVIDQIDRDQENELLEGECTADCSSRLYFYCVSLRVSLCVFLLWTSCNSCLFVELSLCTSHCLSL